MIACIFMVGTTGAGKTTHGRLLAEKLGLTYISTGDIARGLMDEATASEFKEGRLSPHEVKIRSELQKIANASEVVVIDGFPRVKAQMDWFEDVFYAIPCFKVELGWSQEVLVLRWLERMRDEFDTFKAYVLRDELYHSETKTLFSKVVPGVLFDNKKERHMIEINNMIRQAVTDWLKRTHPAFVIKDSHRHRLIDRFMFDHHITAWEPKARAMTYTVEPKEIEKRLWEIINA